jgi:bifunctional DNase/RNase
LRKWLLFALVVFLTIRILPETGLSGEEAGTVELKVARVTVDPIEGRSVVILEDMDGKKAILIWIGVSEANAIYLEINGVEPPRPMTHDLIKSILDGLRTHVQHILIHDVRENIIYARIVLILDGEKILIDARPSDAIALAVRVKAPIFATEEIYQKLSLDLNQEQTKDSELSV